MREQGSRSMLPFATNPFSEPPLRHLPFPSSHYPQAHSFHIGSQETCDLTLYGPSGWVLTHSRGTRLEKLGALQHPTAYNSLIGTPLQDPQSPLKCIHLKDATG